MRDRPARSSSTRRRDPLGAVVVVGLAVAVLGLVVTAFRPSAAPDPSAGDVPATSSLPLCGADSLEAGAPERTTERGTSFLRVPFTPRSGRSCRVGGFPAVTAYAGETLAAVRVVRRPDDGLGRQTSALEVGPGRPAVVAVAWSARSCPVVDNDRLAITLPGSAATATVPGFGRSRCIPGTPDGTLDVFALRGTTRFPFPQNQLVRAGFDR